MSPGSAYWIYPDGFAPAAGQRWDVTRAFIEDRHGGQARIACITPWRSFKGSDLLQLTDVLLGALTSQSQTEAKARVRELVEAQRATVTQDGAVKIFAVSVGNGGRHRPEHA